MENVNLIFQIDNKLVKETYENDENIKIVDYCSEKSKICAIYFSSNEIYYPNTASTFLDAIKKRDKYEWQNNPFPNANRHIFVRDIQKQWYVEGISAKYNTPYLLAEKLKELSSGYSVYTIGSSAGGFAAMLYGSILGAKRVYAFNAQMDLNLIVDNSSATVDPLLFRHLSNDAISPYYKISGFLNAKVHYYYFQSGKSPMDIRQYNSCSQKEILTKIEFTTSNHGFPFLRHDLKFVFGLTEKQLGELVNTKMDPIIFSIKIHGIVKAMVLIISAIGKRLNKKIKEKIHSLN